MIDVEIRMDYHVSTTRVISRIFFEPLSQWHDVYGTELPERWVHEVVTRG